MSRLQAFLDLALNAKSKKDSRHLGNRSTYVGASDICGCPRKAVLSKKHPVEHDSPTLLKFARGHMAEELVDDIFRTGGLTPQREVEIRHPNHPDLLCHIDFLFKSKTGRRHVMELKATDGIPDEPYRNWVDQLHFQMGLLALKYPDTEIGGSILAVDLNKGRYHEFNSYRPNDLIMELLVQKGLHIRSALHGMEEAKAESGILCGYCPYREGCPAFAGEVAIPEEVLILAHQFLATNTVKKELDQTLSRLKADILAFTGTRFRGTADGLSVVSYEVGPSDTVDAKELKARFPDIYQQIKKARAGSERLEVKTVKAAPQVKSKAA
jgi:hypothetical protein